MVYETIRSGSDLNMENETGNLTRLFVWRIPKTNHEALMQLGRPAMELFKNVGVNQEIFQLKVSSDLHERDKMAEQMGFTNIAKTIAAKEDEVCWSYNSTEIRSTLMILEQRCKKMKMQVNLVNSLWIYLP